MPKVTMCFDRVEEFKDHGYYVFDARQKIVMCKFCNVKLDWKRRDSCVKHNECENHKKKRTNVHQSTSKRQIPVPDAFSNAKKQKNSTEEFTMSTVQTFLSANIPLEKLDHPSMRKWLNQQIPGSGNFPTADWLRKKYMPLLKEKLKDQRVIVHCDETTDRMGRAIFIVLFRTLPEDVNETPQVLVGGAHVL